MKTKNVQIKIAMGAPNTTNADPTVAERLAYKPNTPTEPRIHTVEITKPGERHVMRPLPRATFAKTSHTRK